MARTVEQEVGAMTLTLVMDAADVGREPVHMDDVEEECGTEAQIIERLLAGVELMFARIVTDWSGAMRSVARHWVSTAASAEEVVQETWLAVLRGLRRFEGRSSLRTWVFQILINRAKTRAIRESRVVPMSTVYASDDRDIEAELAETEAEDAAPRFGRVGGSRLAVEGPEPHCLANELCDHLRSALRRLPERQRTVVELRDVQGFTSDEVCAVLGLSAQNQRVLLHRGRAKLRTALEGYYRSGDDLPVAG
jgi:RNA polymerase sigma-70 factor (ECF subfamily)